MNSASGERRAPIPTETADIDAAEAMAASFADPLNEARGGAGGAGALNNSGIGSETSIPRRGGAGKPSKFGVPQ